MTDKKYTIKDIARLAGVSAGTVDRVLHKRGDVSIKSFEKVKKVLDEIDYEPNVFAIGLAAKKHYTFICIVPDFIEGDYWHSVYLGIERARKEFRSFNIEIKYQMFQHGNPDSFWEACKKASEDSADAVLLAPNFRESTLELLKILKTKHVPFVFIDFNIEDAGALEYIGQDSFLSGFIAAKILMSDYKQGEELVLFLSDTKDSPAEIQMKRRLDGFMHYLHQNIGDLKIHEVVLDKVDVDRNELVLGRFFQQNPDATYGAVFNSRVYLVGDFLKNHASKMKGLIGYDLLEKNVELMKQGYISCLIGQRPGLQGYCGVRALCSNVVFKKQVQDTRYMPIDILIKENIDFYFEFV